LTALLIPVSKNPPVCGLVKADWDGVGPLTDHVPADEVTTEGETALSTTMANSFTTLVFKTTGKYVYNLSIINMVKISNKTCL